MPWSEARPYPGFDDPLTEVNEPPTTTWLPSAFATRASTPPSATVAVQGSSAPVAVLQAARSFRVVLLALEKTPPTYNVVLVTAREVTRALVPGFQGETRAPVAVLKAATRYRFCPPADVKLPPM